jgi:hypothetical protein
LIDLYIDELRASLGQIGARSIAEAREASIRHPGVFEFPAKRARKRPVNARPPAHASVPEITISIKIIPDLRRPQWRFTATAYTKSGFFPRMHMSAAAEPLEHIVPDDNLARRNALVLSAAQALAGGNNTVIVSTASIVGAVLAPDKGLATLPVTAMVFGMWLARCRSACWRANSADVSLFNAARLSASFPV